MKLLIVEDEKALSDAIVEYLTSEGYGCETALNFWTADEKVALYDYDCVLVDISLPDGSGFEVIKELKKRKSEAGIIIISAKNSLDDKITGLEIGADDYMTKPFHLSELNARIKSIIRRRNFGGQTTIIANEIIIIPDEVLVKVNNQPLELTKKEYDLLLFLLSNKNRVLTKESIAEHLWGDDMDTADSFDFIYTHIKNLRKKITEKGGKDYLKTIYGMGYKFQI
jgi:DNA-binding response OmpR family regulator